MELFFDLMFPMLWIAVFAASYTMFRSKRVNRGLPLGLLLWGIGLFLVSLLRWGILPTDDDSMFVFSSFSYLLSVSGFVLIIVGVTMLAFSLKGRADKNSLGSKPRDLRTLVLPRNDRSSLSKAVVMRDSVCAGLVDRAKSDGLHFIQQFSPPHSPSVWFRLEYLIPTNDPHVNLTAYVAVTVDIHEFHRFENTLKVEAAVGTKSWVLSGLISLDENDLDAIHFYIIHPSPKPKFRSRLRRWPFELWYPSNKVARVKPDWLAVSFVLCALIWFVFPVLLTQRLWVFPFAAISGSVAILAFCLYNYKRRTHVLTAGKPEEDPRNLLWLDSWQANVSGLGVIGTDVRKGIIARLEHAAPSGMSVVTEQVGYWGTESWVERDQVVVKHRRAIGFVHVESYADVLYVAWQSHLNRASWVEKKIASGIDKITGLKVVANQVVEGRLLLTDYDVNDSNFLAEWMHEAVKREVKLQMAEREIDQEIDFTVIRESRGEARAEDSDAEGSGKKRGNPLGFFRIG